MQIPSSKKKKTVNADTLLIENNTLDMNCASISY